MLDAGVSDQQFHHQHSRHLYLRQNAPVPIQTDECHVPGAGQRNDVVEQEEREAAGPRQLPAAAQHVRCVDADQQADGEVGQGQVQDEIIAVRAQFAVDGEGGDNEGVSGDGDDADETDQRRQNDSRSDVVAVLTQHLACRRSAKIPVPWPRSRRLWKRHFNRSTLLSPRRKEQRYDRCSRSCYPTWLLVRPGDVLNDEK